MNFRHKFLYLVPLIALSGCAANNEAPKLEKVTWETKVTKTSIPVEIKFKPGNTMISTSTKNSLKSGLKVPQDTYFRVFGQNVHIQTSTTALRIENIITYLNTLGVPRYNIEVFEQADDHKGAANTLTVFIDHYQVVAPKCPGWNQEINSSVSPEGELNFGCATERNFAMMIADPRVIDSGRPLDGVDANRSNKAIDNYRADTIKTLKIEKIEKSS